MGAAAEGESGGRGRRMRRVGAREAASIERDANEMEKEELRGVDEGQ